MDQALFEWKVRLLFEKCTRVSSLPRKCGDSIFLEQNYFITEEPYLYLRRSHWFLWVEPEPSSFGYILVSGQLFNIHHFGWGMKINEASDRNPFLLDMYNMWEIQSSSHISHQPWERLWTLSISENAHCKSKSHTVDQRLEGKKWLSSNTLSWCFPSGEEWDGSGRCLWC